VMTGRDFRWNIDFLLSNPSQENDVLSVELSVEGYTADLLHRLEATYILVREHLRRSAESSSNWYNRKVKPPEFSVGSEVYVYCPRRFKSRTPKWQSFYKATGVVERKLNDVSYVISSQSWKQLRIVHVDKLKPVIIYQDTHN
jgi:hypothetical protein